MKIDKWWGERQKVKDIHTGCDVTGRELGDGKTVCRIR